MTNKLAIEALKNISDNVYRYERAQIRDVANSALAALSTEADESVAWTVTVGESFENCIEITHCEADARAQYEASTEGGYEILYMLWSLYTRPAPKDEAVAQLDAAFEDEIKLVSTIEYSSNDICRSFYRELRKRILSAPIEQGDGK